MRIIERAAAAGAGEGGEGARRAGGLNVNDGPSDAKEHNFRRRRNDRGRDRMDRERRERSEIKGG